MLALPLLFLFADLAKPGAGAAALELAGTQFPVLGWIRSEGQTDTPPVRALLDAGLALGLSRLDLHGLDRRLHQPPVDGVRLKLPEQRSLQLRGQRQPLDPDLVRDILLDRLPLLDVLADRIHRGGVPVIVNL